MNLYPVQPGWACTCLMALYPVQPRWKSSTARVSLHLCLFSGHLSRTALVSLHRFNDPLSSTARVSLRLHLFNGPLSSTVWVSLRLCQLSETLSQYTILIVLKFLSQSSIPIKSDTNENPEETAKRNVKNPEDKNPHFHYARLILDLMRSWLIVGLLLLTPLTVWPLAGLQQPQHRWEWE